MKYKTNAIGIDLMVAQFEMRGGAGSWDADKKAIWCKEGSGDKGDKSGGEGTEKVGAALEHPQLW